METKKFIWGAEYQVGVPWIDEQHEHFFIIVNEIAQNATKEPLTRADVLAVLERLANHAFYHFDAEEKYLIDARNPKTSGHLAPHKKYRDEIDDFIRRAKQETTDVRQLAEQAAAFAGDWLTRHMWGSDQEKKSSSKI